MKSTSAYIISVVALALLLFALQMQLPKRFDWTPTFCSDDSNPFGCMAFDSVMSHSMKGRYRVSTISLSQAGRAKNVVNILIVARSLDLSKRDIKALKNIMLRGGNVVLAYSDNSDVADTSPIYEAFGLAANGSSMFDVRWLQQKILDGSASLYDTLWTAAGSSSGQGASFRCFSDLVQDSVVIDSLAPAEIVAWRYASEPHGRSHSKLCPPPGRAIPVAACRPWGRGRLYVVSLPLLFTNYGILDPEATRFVHRLMGRLSAKPVLRIQPASLAGNGTASAQPPLRYVFSQPPLRMALCVLLAASLLFVAFNSRRRQRAIPVVRPPKQNSVEFSKMVGTLYYLRHDNSDLVRKRFARFAAQLRIEIGIDVSSPSDDRESCRQLAAAAGIEAADVQQSLFRLRYVCANESFVVDDGEMASLLGWMDDVEEKVRA